MAGPNVVISVLADTAKSKRDLDDLSNAGSKIGSAFAGMSKIAGAALLAAGVAVTAFLGTSIAAAAESEKIAAQTNAVLQSTQGIAGQTKESIDALSTSLSRMSGIDDELIQKGANVLLTFTNIRGVNFDKATESALNMSVALGQDLESASRLVGRALNDPIAGLGALTRVGVQFTESQKDAIQAMVQAGDVAGAQGIILDQLAVKFGGSAEAFGNTYLGAVGKVQTAFGNLQEAVGGAFLPVLTDGLGRVADMLNTIADSPAFQSILTGISSFLSGLLDGGAAASTFGEAFRVVSAILNPFGVIIQALLPVLPSLQAAFLALAQALGGALLSILPTLSGLLDSIVGALSGVLAGVLPVVISLFTTLANTFARILPILTPLIDLIAGILSDTLDQLTPLIVMLAQAAGTILTAAITALVPLLEGLMPVFTAILEAVSPLISIVISLVTPFLALLEPIGQLIGALLPPLIELLLAVSPVIQLLVPILELLTPVLQFVADALANVVGFVVEVIDAFVALVSGSDDAQAKVLAIWQKVLNFFRGIPKAIGDFFAGAGQWLVDAGRNIIQGLLNGLSAMGATIGRFFLNLLPSWIVGPFKAALGIRSPSVVFRALGQMIPAGVVLGVSDGLSAISAAAGNMATAAVNGFSTTPLSASATYAGGGGSGWAGEVHIHLDGKVYMTAAEVGRAIKEALDEYFRLGGPPAWGAP